MEVNLINNEFNLNLLVVKYTTFLAKQRKILPKKNFEKLKIFTKISKVSKDYLKISKIQFTGATLQIQRYFR